MSALSPTVLIALAMGLLTFLLLRRAAKRGLPRGSGQAIERLARPTSAASHGYDAPEAVAKWDVYLLERSREISAILDSKLSAMQALVRQADEQAARLEKALREADEKSV
jgi:hypothetical protein